MKTHSLKKVAIFTLAATLFWSCGDDKKKNTVSSTTTGVTLPTTNTPQLSAGNYSNLLSQINCRSGNRLSNIYSFSSSSFSGNSQTTIQGTFNAGGIGGTTVAREYIGVGYYGDVMIVQKVTNGSQVIGYNVLLSMCSMNSSSGAPYISDSRQLTNFAGKIVLDDEVSCGHGMVDSSQTTMQSQVDPNYPYLPVFKVDTWFTKVGCVSY
ncbi:hypothetical protein BIY24_02750 [Halobacteriovorax marinus]|uniref:Exported protein n=1 Tax=Halobacteriovorax marinus (strain ATCC BAA-682 / DSM 15412 / SJ) TaxID=862908 RepID=E1X4N1_HALMS|nr:hypothetical protein [Halobacteriovorax marinus]ATH06892.1 hypothetical protein BIY24_02750 [Halobacteriovorax marinus]CBW25461.1 putative exported protein [Halobacteriovorax marinus SJ]